MLRAQLGALRATHAALEEMDARAFRNHIVTAVRR
jgi:hypothetical protein